MKDSQKKAKFSLDKFEVAKLRNLKNIKGGDGTNDTADGLQASTKQCNASKNSNPPCDKVVVGTN